MGFSNLSIDLGQLPRAEEVELKPLSSKYLRVLRTEYLITTTILLVITAVLIYFIDELREGFGWMLLAGGVLLVIIWIITYVENAFRKRAFAIREHDVIYQSGWLIQSLRIIPYKRVQNCTVQSGPLERGQGLATMVVFTAGSTGADLRIPGLDAEEAETLRQFVLSQIQKEERGQI